MILKAVKPHRWIPIIMIAWSIVMTLTGLVKNGAGLQVSLFIAKLIGFLILSRLLVSS